MKITLVSAIAIIGAFAGVSQSANAASGWTNFGTIGAINQQPITTPGSEMVFINVSVSTNPSDSSACSVRDGFYFAVTTDRDKRLFSMLLMAKATGQKVQVYVTANCHLWGYAEMQGMVIQ